jgi:CRISPR-associated exonuclease Cas4
MLGEDDFAPLSGLQHLVYCERQVALIHVEQLWASDANTTRGDIFHERAHLPGTDARRGAKVLRSVRLASEALQLSGVADIVEYHRDASFPGGWRPFPVEYKRGKAKNEKADQVQLCAQALCLEEMHGAPIEKGALFYGTSHKRVEVLFTPLLRAETTRAAARLHAMLRSGELPAPVFGPKCRRCSLLDLCQPETLGSRVRAQSYLRELWRRATNPEEAP